MRALLLRLGRLILVLLAVTAASFSLIRLLPGDTVDAVLGEGATAADRAAARADLRLDDPLPVRYASWVADAVQGDLGRSYRTHQPVAEAIAERLPLTLELVLLSQLLALALAVPMAVVAALKRGSGYDRGISALSLGMLAAPSYMVAVGMLAVFAVRLGWFPAAGYTPFGDSPFEHFRSLALPAAALAIQEVAMYMRLLRNDVVETLRQDYVTAARAKGLSTRRIITSHVLRPSSIGLVTLSGVTIGRMVGGTVLVERIFGLPGLGRYTIDSVNNRDFLALQGAVVVFTVGFVVVNFLVDISYGLIDPRTRTATG